ncbi:MULTISPECIES: bifunctional diguanylate cyclase/phosphodiesterase [Methylococcus]|uniref:EAL domain-containing protein n=1 Tax=Methylococcus capsulatus TaxID=414 RepID=A0ABZ2F2C6_METCP|nr:MULTISPECIES: EAL domain-containing protein [Methylococcus]MDF9391798.1 EAL domain-containing protein [Methylococcus capsulatus]
MSNEAKGAAPRAKRLAVLQPFRRFLPWSVIVALALFTTLLGGLQFCLSYVQQSRLHASETLAAVVQAKFQHVAHWRAERLADAEQVAGNAPFLAAAAAWLAADKEETASTQLVLSRMESFLAMGSYRNVLLLDVAGRIRLSLTPQGGDDRGGFYERVPMPMVDEGARPLLGDWYLSQNQAELLADVFIPVSHEVNGEHRLVGAIVMVADAGHFLRALLESLSQFRPEISFIGQGGNRMVSLDRDFLAREGTPSSPAKPLSEAALRITQGDRGLLTQERDGGVTLLSLGESIPGSSWYVMAEATATQLSQENQPFFLGSSLLALLGALAAGAALLGRRSERNHLQAVLKAERERADLLRRFEYFVRYANDAILLADRDHHIVDANDRALELYGYSRAELIGLALADIVAGNAEAVQQIRLDEALARGGGVWESVHTRKDGGAVPVELSIRLISVDGSDFVQAIVRDVSERKRIELALARQKNLYGLLAQTNQIIVRHTCEQDLFDAICRIAVRNGGFRFAWIGMLECETSTLVPVARYGDDAGYLGRLHVSGAAAAQHHDLTHMAVTAGRHMISDDFLADPLTRPWHEAGIAAGVRASGAFPIRRFGEVVGAINLYAGEPGFFSEDIVAVLDTMAMDVSFALDILAHDAERARSEMRLRESEERFRLAANSAPVLIWMGDTAGACTFFNDMWLNFTGRSLGYELVDGWLEGVHPEDRSRWTGAYSAAFAARKPFEIEYRLRRRDGEYRTMLGKATPRFDAGGEFIGYIGSCIDISDRKKGDERLMLAGKVFEAVRESIMVTDANGVIVAVNPAFSDMTGYSPEEAVGKTPAFLQSGRHGKEYYAALWRAIDQEGSWQGEFWNRRKNGELFAVLETIVAVRDEAGATVNYIGVAADISSLKAAEEHIHHLAYYDPLSSLPNRRYLMERAEYALALAERRKEELAVVFLDVDHFKDVNDSLGHQVGDELLVRVAAQIKEFTRDTDTVARLGGDEFALLLPDLGRDAVSQVAEKILVALRKPFEHSGQAFAVTGSIGIALYPHDGTDFETLLRNADTAMYHAKQQGRNRFRFYDPGMNVDILARLTVLSELREAISVGELRTFFQPEIDLASGQLVGAEALVRWQHPARGLLSPDQFIPIAESNDLIVAVSDWVLEDTCRHLAQWKKADLAPITVGVNLSARHFRDPRLVQRVESLLCRYGVPGSSLQLELTESTLLDADGQTMVVLQALIALGCSLSIDDFGTGYSSLSYLKNLPIATLKIDQSFVRDIAFDADDRTISGTVVALGHSLGLKVIAEGVESEEQRRILLEQGCDFGQGYLFSCPLSPKEFTKWRMEHALRLETDLRYRD